MNTKTRVKQLEELVSRKNDKGLLILIKLDDESEDECISRYDLTDYPRHNLLIGSELDERI